LSHRRIVCASHDRQKTRRTNGRSLKFVIADVKRSDIGSTAAAYAQAWLCGSTFHGRPIPPAPVDALTVNPYLGSDGVRPFVEAGASAGRAVFILVRTSNPSSREIQELECSPGQPLYRWVGSLVADWGADLVGAEGFSSVGAVVGATQPEALEQLRAQMPRVPFLVPGYGAQGGSLEAIRRALDGRGRGAWVSASRSILFAYRTDRHRGRSWQESAAFEARAMRDALRDLGGAAV